MFHTKNVSKNIYFLESQSKSLKKFTAELKEVEFA